VRRSRLLRDIPAMTFDLDISGLLTCFVCS
jgi:hypothetical protein